MKDGWRSSTLIALRQPEKPVPSDTFSTGEICC
jgi:hypothetical protein